MKNGKHLIIDAYKCDKNPMWDVALIKEVCLKVTNMIGLRPLSEPLIYEVDESMIAKEETGITGGIIFMESHFTFHAFPEKHYFSADIYSCKGFDHEKVVEFLATVFGSKDMNHTVLLRGNKL